CIVTACQGQKCPSVEVVTAVLLNVGVCPFAIVMVVDRDSERNMVHKHKVSQLEEDTAPGFALRLRPRANKNLHIASGYASGVLLHHICPQPEALPSGYAPGQIKICISPQAMPQAFYCTIFALRKDLCKFLIPWG
ncbi:hypothetical protein Tsp_16117, partial [Trichinella spiralis]|uniref:hypothetical protein n=1 Tax=Trichinella spiralis TaxID=6334 RepID=UPI0001EFDD0F